MLFVVWPPVFAPVLLFLLFLHCSGFAELLENEAGKLFGKEHLCSWQVRIWSISFIVYDRWWGLKHICKCNGPYCWWMRLLPIGYRRIVRSVEIS